MNEVDPLRSQFENAKRQFRAFASKKPEVSSLIFEKETPFLIIDLDGIKERFDKVSESFKGFEIFYAVKANDEQKVIKTLAKAGA
ncbi:MAG: type III PLP-dependent enzyme, partial [Aquificaceae bacterium]|nr:type III PLP-dependent enzyme [Aquificaceae bacterium]